MPRYTPQTAKLKAQRLIKLHNQNGCNQTRVAEIEGVTPSAINHRLSKQPVRDTLQEYLDSPETKRKLEKVAEEGLSATKVISANITYGDADEKTNDFIDVPDHHARHKFWRDMMVGCGKLKVNSAGGVTISTVVINFKSPEKVFNEKELNAANRITE